MTSAAKNYALAACLLIFAQTLAGCAFLLSLDQIPRERVMPSDSNAVIVGIHVSSPEALFSHPFTADQILFVKLEDGSSDNILQGQILPNTHFRFGYAFLPNAQPGHYAAIGCTFHVGGIRPYSYTLLFDRALVTRLTRTIAPRTVVLLGNIVVGGKFQAQEEDYDDVQQHYFRKLTGKDIRTALGEGRGFFTQSTLVRGVPRAGRLKQEYPLDSASRQFLNILLEGLPTAWKPWLDKSGGPGP
jgi:hypothetical protein